MAFRLKDHNVTTFDDCSDPLLDAMTKLPDYRMNGCTGYFRPPLDCTIRVTDSVVITTSSSDHNAIDYFKLIYKYEARQLLTVWFMSSRNQ